MWISDLFRRDEPLANNSRSAVIWLSYFHDPEARSAFQRLKRNLRDQIPVFGVVNEGEARRAGSSPDFIKVTHDDLRRAMPARADGILTSGSLDAGCADALHMAAIACLPGYEHYWFIEYDVDFSANWRGFFREFDGCEADLLGTTIYPRSMTQDWFHWRSFVAPEGVETSAHTRSFLPVFRISRRFADFYESETGRGWQGHFEALYPTIALANHFRIEDVGGTGPFVGKERQGRFYTNDFLSADLSPGTFRFLPPVSSRYFSISNLQLRPRAMLWHPIKTTAFNDERRRIIPPE